MGSGRDITISVVSHRQNVLTNRLLEDIGRVCADRVMVVVTLNVVDPEPLATQRLSCPVEVLVNQRAKGFGANHNAAFLQCQSEFFCVLNPDISLAADPFPPLLDTLRTSGAGVVGPLVRHPGGTVEDSARRFPTFPVLLKRLFGRPAGPDYAHDAGAVQVDWVAGMFMLFRTAAYRLVGGFDERFFLYYEDVDICRRLRNSGKSVWYDPRAEVIHAAQRASRTNARFAIHHLASVIRFLVRS